MSPFLVLFTRAGEPEPGVFGSLELEPLEKKLGTGAGAAWQKSQEPEQIKNYPAPQPCWKIKSIRKIVLVFLFFR